MFLHFYFFFLTLTVVSFNSKNDSAEYLATKCSSNFTKIPLKNKSYRRTINYLHISRTIYLI